MEFFFRPRGIAVVGATVNEKKGGHTIIRNLMRGYDGRIYPVNPAYEEVDGLACYASVQEVPSPVDLAIVFVPAKFVPNVIRDCVQRGIKGVMIESGGFAETGEDGRALQNELKQIARDTGIRLWGPNCMGLVDAVNQQVFSFVSPAIWDEGLPAGNVSLIVQSGMLSGAFLIDLISHGVMGISKVCSIGNKVDVNECDLLEYFENDPDTAAIGLYLESIPEGRKFYDLCRRSGKPITVLKGGRSEGGAKAAMSHTASMSGNGALISGALAQAGVTEARDFKQMMDITRSLASFPDLKLNRQGRVAILTYSGGAGILSTDFMDDLGLKLAELSPAAMEQLKTVFPEWMPPANPVDLWPAVERNGSERAYGVSARAVMADPDVDGVLVHYFVGGGLLEQDVEQLAAIAREYGKPMFAWALGSREKLRELRRVAQTAGVPVFGELFRAVECMAAVLGRTTAPPAADDSLGEDLNADAAPAVPAALSGALDEHVSKNVLKEAGIPVVEEDSPATPEDAVRIADGFGYPVVMKGLSPGGIHKTELGLVRLNIGSSSEVKRGYADLMKSMQGRGTVLIQKQVKSGLEMIAGLVRDPQFGLCVMCGLGGVFTEVLGDAVFGPAPLDHGTALRLIGRLKNQKLLDGFRGAAPLNRDAMADLLVKLGQLGASEKRIEQVDINPLIVCDGLPVAVDASIVLSD